MDGDPPRDLEALLPAPRHHALAIYHSIKYIREGLSALLHGKLSVAVLDATAVTVSMVRGDFSTASSVMFMLRLAEILEDWTHKKSVADLAGAMSLNVDHVWLKTGETETLVPIGDIQAGDCVVVRTGGLIPLDGKVVSGEAMVNQASMTGESMPVPKREAAMSTQAPSPKRASVSCAWKRRSAAAAMTASCA